MDQMLTVIGIVGGLGGASPRLAREAVCIETFDLADIRGKYVNRYRRGINVVLLDPELAEAFPDSKSVNDALRALMAIATRAEPRKRA
jgi:hypothetical protein